ncbi:flap endonuclease 1-like [Gossypium raimondii]|uniref:flap endonuclease 1-like n=1 Tax=Gossypium raimondii TaxID=29730 RepID=UPI00063AD5AA|nr:flap endonuclease 1-like [Gossypium raimondii]XP_012487929.1 flap endonuclease 1-like [Gossypium raimondii]XP_052489103.1 flap endonuclease 1-like [Gossypium raimondii]XP_052489104.1 flap endonuclease 1-like [Gossypium raimondii]
MGCMGTKMLTNEAGEVTSHLQGMFTRTIRLLEAGLKPVYVFDGQPPDLKKQELAKRYSKKAEATEGLQEAMEIVGYKLSIGLALEITLSENLINNHLLTLFWL